MIVEPGAEDNQVGEAQGVIHDVLDLRSEAEFASALRTNTPTLVALADVSSADWRDCGALRGGAEPKHARRACRWPR